MNDYKVVLAWLPHPWTLAEWLLWKAASIPTSPHLPACWDYMAPGHLLSEDCAACTHQSYHPQAEEDFSLVEKLCRVKRCGRWSRQLFLRLGSQQAEPKVGIPMEVVS